MLSHISYLLLVINFHIYACSMKILVTLFMTLLCSSIEKIDRKIFKYILHIEKENYINFMLLIITTTKDKDTYIQ